LGFGVVRLQLQRGVQISSGLVGLSQGERKLCELAQTDHDSIYVIVFRRGEIARGQRRLRRLELSLEGLGRIIRCSTGGENPYRQGRHQREACRDAFQKATQEDSSLANRGHGIVPEIIENIAARIKAGPACSTSVARRAV